MKGRKKLKEENWKRNTEPMKGKLKENEKPSFDSRRCLRKRRTKSSKKLLMIMDFSLVRSPPMSELSVREHTKTTLLMVCLKNNARTLNFELCGKWMHCSCLSRDQSGLYICYICNILFTVNLEMLAEKIFRILGVTNMLSNINFSDWKFTENC